MQWGPKKLELIPVFLLVYEEIKTTNAGFYRLV